MAHRPRYDIYSIHSFSITAYAAFRVPGDAGAYPSYLRPEAGYTLDKFPDYCRAKIFIAIIKNKTNKDFNKVHYLLLVHQKTKFFHGSDFKLAGLSDANVCHRLPAFATFTLLQDMYKRAEDDGHTCVDGYKNTLLPVCRPSYVHDDIKPLSVLQNRKSYDTVPSSQLVLSFINA